MCAQLYSAVIILYERQADWGKSMAYESPCNSVAHKIEERQILDLDRYGLIVTTHRIVQHAKHLSGRPAEAVAIAFTVTKSYDSFFTRIGNAGKRRVVIAYNEDRFMSYDVSDKLVRALEEKSLPYYEADYDDDGNKTEGTFGVYNITDAIPKDEASILVRALNDAFKKARDLFRREINADKQQNLAQQQKATDDLLSGLRSLKKL
jgi:hypothetical protein